MSWRLLYRIEQGARVRENYEKEFEEVYELDSADDFNAFLVSFKKKGGTLVERKNGVAFYFTVEGVDLERRAPTPTGKVQVVARVTLSVLKRSSELIPPWELAPYRFRATTSQLETTSTQFFPGVGDIVWPQGTYEARPFVNTAGVGLKGKSTRATTRIAFSYNVPASSFDPRLVWAPIGKINLRTTTVCGMTFPPRTLRLDGINAEYCTESVDTNDSSGNRITTTWKFYRVDASLTANPLSYDQLFANVGSHVNINGTLCRIWRWTDPSTNTARYGTYAQYLASGGYDGEQATTPMPLMSNGEEVSPIHTYRVGSPYEPVDFNALGFPTAAPECWNAFDENDRT